MLFGAYVRHGNIQKKGRFTQVAAAAYLAIGLFRRVDYKLMGLEI